MGTGLVDRACILGLIEQGEGRLIEFKRFAVGAFLICASDERAMGWECSVRPHHQMAVSYH